MITLIKDLTRILSFLDSALNFLDPPRKRLDPMDKLKASRYFGLGCQNVTNTRLGNDAQDHNKSREKVKKWLI
jgi:hypothetical protein